MSAYVRLVESLLLEMGQRGRYKERQAAKLRQQDAEAAAGARNPTPLSPAPNPAAPSPVDRRGPGGASGDTDELGRPRIDGRKPKDPEIEIDPEKVKADAEKRAKMPNQRRRRGTPEQEARMKGTKGIARAVDRAGALGSIARRLASRYSDTLPSQSGSAEKIRNFRRGMDTMGKGAMSGVKKFLKTGQNVRPSGPLI